MSLQKGHLFFRMATVPFVVVQFGHCVRTHDSDRVALDDLRHLALIRIIGSEVRKERTRVDDDHESPNPSSQVSRWRVTSDP